MAMRYFKSPEGEVHGYDDADEAWEALMQSQAVDAEWEEVTGSWPPPAPVIPAAPDTSAFMIAVKAALGGAVALNTLLRAYPLLQPSLAAAAWTDAQALLDDAKITGAVTAAEFAAIQAAAAASHIPIALS